MRPTRKRLLAGLAVFLSVLAVVASTAVLLLVGEPAGGAGDDALAGRLAKLIPVLLIASGAGCWLWFKLDTQYVQAPLRMAEQLAATLPHAGLRVGRYEAPELDQLAQVVNQLLAQREADRSEVAEHFRATQASLAEERGRLSALMADLSQSVVVCNLDGRVLLYNQRAKQELSTGPDGDRTELLGLGRSIHAVLDRAVIGYAIARLRQASAEVDSGHAPGVVGSTHFVTGTASGRLLRAHMSPVLGKTGRHHADGGAPSMTGFVLVLDDVTTTNERHTRRDAVIQSLIEGCRGPLGSVRAAAEMLCDFPDMSGEQKDRFTLAIRDEATALSAQFDKAARAFSSDLRERWVLEEINGAEILLATAGSIREKGGGGRPPIAVKTEHVEKGLWLRVDSFALLQALRYLALRLQDDYGIREVRLSLTRSGHLAQLDLSWQGTFMNNETAMSWLQDPMNVPGKSSSLSVTDVVERCNGDIWFQRERVSHRAFFRTVLPMAAAPGNLPMPMTVATAEERPEFYDFDLFGWSESGHELDDRPLGELAYTVFDTETTGLHPAEGDEIIQIGATRIINGRLLRQECFEQLVKPQVRLSPGSIAVHGLTRELLAAQPGIDVVLPRFHAFCADTVLVGHNAAFDMRFLQLQEKRTGVRFEQPVLDTLLLSSVLHPNQATHQLEAIAERLAVPVLGRHTALGDAMVTAEVFLKMLPLLTEVGVKTLRQAREASQTSYLARVRY
ncbi:exonuclease domain-containing protein [Accumulibacter sp.]|uniref:3'-5' exonuclease n=1 Tax=Accumulibacter sp. TaxID=2053492 RepID=UPI002600C6F7|nr:exonuclease domain-containing protein [Accumulibacter sp.]MCM8613670.1 exonuclease domain-containing protein [Accumulibacter sp.]MCM8637302.1 exonuclease domain-containing protein [Accumulibacter sp.]MCM8638214.1 exonuclease domain-containing protein [Accumulibacter sp.]